MKLCMMGEKKTKKGGLRVVVENKKEETIAKKLCCSSLKILPLVHTLSLCLPTGLVSSFGFNRLLRSSSFSSSILNLLSIQNKYQINFSNLFLQLLYNNFKNNEGRNSKK